MRTSFCEAEGVRFSNEAVEKLAFQRQVQIDHITDRGKICFSVNL
jgi:hypothetical protein